MARAETDSRGRNAQLCRYRRGGRQAQGRARGGKRQWREQCRCADPLPPGGAQRRLARRLCLRVGNQGRAFEKGNEMTDRIAEFRALHVRSEEHTSELQSLMRSSYAVFCLKQKNK